MNIHVKALNKTETEFKNAVRSHIMAKLVSSQEYRVFNIHNSINVMGHISRLKDRLIHCCWKYKPVQEIRVKVSQLKIN